MKSLPLQNGVSAGPVIMTDDRAGEPDVRIERAVAGYDDDPVLLGASLELSSGEVLSLLGPSGCGKTTLLRTIAGLTPLRSGSIEIGGRVVSGPGIHLPPERRQVGMVFQDGALFPHLTVGQNILFGLRHHAAAQQRLAEVLDLTSLAALVDRLPGTLSGGQQQRVALARALAPQPRVLLMDEPFSALDARLRIQLRREVKEILHRVGITALVVTHDQDEAFAVGDRVGVMNDGQLLQVGTPKELYEEPVLPWVASFVGEANELVGPYKAGRVCTSIGELPVDLDAAEGSMVRIVVRPEQLELVAGTSATLTGIEYFGHDARYEVATGQTVLGVRTVRTEFEPGEHVGVQFLGGRVAAWLEPA
ncbi:MAG: iron(III) transport system ATP-binding protein [Acidimicrobiales bacterium]|jgi:iron(III) transport system ATP-binding protein